MCLHGRTAAKKWGDVLERAEAYIKVATFIHPAPPARLNLCHILQRPSNLPPLYPLQARPWRTPVPSLIHDKMFSERKWPIRNQAARFRLER